ncbi:MAG: zinc ribbon domain-containing protein [Deltaproteobacteria bacterium]|nr:zinc ribbon domain-containing protein [Deltaproteobacteria bacterium]
MPIYEYECDSCGAVKEVIQKFSDKPLRACSQCSGKLRKLVSQSSFHLKGSGWYVTDYADKKQSTKASPETESEKPAEPKKKTETKTEKKE